MTAQPEHHLPSARQRLADQIHNLAGRQRLTVNRDDRATRDTLADIERQHQAALLDLEQQMLPEYSHARHRANLQRRHEERVVAITATTSFTPSRYDQLADALQGSRLERGGHSADPSTPIWVDAAELITEITQHTHEWEASWQLPAGTVPELLHALADHPWRPQDVPAINTIADNCARWTARIDNLFNPPREFTVPAPCPDCQVAIVYRQDATGETVRKPALQIRSGSGCVCLNCGHDWAPEHYAFLAKRLGLLPNNVLE